MSKEVMNKTKPAIEKDKKNSKQTMQIQKYTNMDLQ